MKSFGRLLAYLVVTGGILFGLAGGMMWLVHPDARSKEEARAPVIPPRIADSIERKREPARPVEPETPKPVMREASVALTPAPQPKLAIREMSPPPRARPRKVAPEGRTADPAPAPAAIVTTARTDFPY